MSTITKKFIPSKSQAAQGGRASGPSKARKGARAAALVRWAKPTVTLDASGARCVVLPRGWLKGYGIDTEDGMTLSLEPAPVATSA